MWVLRNVVGVGGGGNPINIEEDERFSDLLWYIRLGCPRKCAIIGLISPVPPQLCTILVTSSDQDMKYSCAAAANADTFAGSFKP